MFDTFFIYQYGGYGGYGMGVSFLHVPNELE
jgi:hypothetical protein